MPLKQFWSYLGSKALAVKIRIKIMGIALGLVILLGGSVTLLVRRNFGATLVAELVERGTAIASDVAGRAESSLLKRDIFPLYSLVGQAAEDNEGVRYIFILDRPRDILVHTFQGSFPTDLLAVEGMPTQREASKFSVRIFDIGTGVVYDVSLPIGDTGSGTVHVGMSASGVQKTVADITHHIVAATAVASLIGVFAAYLLTGILTRPILDLVAVVEAVGSGDFQRRARRWADDEIGHLCSAFNTMTENLSRTRDKLQQEERMRSHLLEKLISAQEDERRRVARELHDQTGQALTSLMVGLKNAEMAPSLEEAARRTAELRALTARTIEEVQALSVGLHPSVLDDLGLVAALERYAAEFSRQHHVKVDYEATGFDGGKRLSPQIEITLYRIAQEALTNIARHAEPQNASVVIELRDGQVVVIVEDDGKGFDPEAVLQSNLDEKLGLFSMQERISLVGGTLTIESSSGQGTTVFAEAPI